MALPLKAPSSSISARRRGAPIVASRRARLAAKGHGAGSVARPAEPGGDPDVDPDVEVAAEGAVTPRRSRTDGTGYLSMYFRDMAALHVLRPEEEFTTAREIEALELAQWETVLGFGPGLGLVLDAVEEEMGAAAATHPAIRNLRRLVVDAGRGKAGAARLARAAKKHAVTLREADQDKLWADAAVAAVERAARGLGRPGGAPPRALVKARGFADWVRRVGAADRASHQARNAFVKANLRLVVSIARRFNHGRMSLADLIQEGNLGLMKAVERYDYRRGFRFSTYASWWIRHAISRALADKGREIRLPVHMIDAQHRLAKARRELTAKLGRSPTSPELAEATQMPLDKIEKMRTWVLDQSVSLDRPVGDEDGRVLGEILEDPDREEASPTDDLEMESLIAELRALLHELKPIEADILRRRFGLDNDQELTLKEIGEKYNLSRERIRQLQEQALGKMRRALARRELM
ncbi:MAG: sigma-70 family RNA polymerase sigma factor [Kofleriaceae bacterium]|nr:sigma-70 family RNA polymerase sigma factor [Kofleriaceae bacterium]